MKFQFEQALDACLAQLNTGADFEAVLAGFPDYTDELRPALAASEWMQRLAPPPQRKLDSKSAFVAAVAERRRLVERVDGLVVEVKVGVSVNELLARTALPLQGVVFAAHAMHADILPMPSADVIAQGKVEFMARVAQRRGTEARGVSAAAPRSRGAWRSVFGGIAPRPTLARRAMSSAVALTLACSVAMTGIVQVGRAAASSLPGETLYQVKIIGQNARMLFSFDPDARSALRAKFAQSRMTDIETLVVSGRNVPAEAVEQLLEEQSAIDGLSAVQRAMLGGLVRDMTNKDADLAARLRDAAGDPSTIDALLQDDRMDDGPIPQRKPAEVALPDEDRTPRNVEAPRASDDRPAAEPAKQPTAHVVAPPAGLQLIESAPPPPAEANNGSGDDHRAAPAGSSTGGEDAGGPAGGPAPTNPDPADLPVPPQTQPNGDPPGMEPPAGGAPAP
ncbi:MAG: DUF5667 domain-containing protein [Ardenticatenales bacterium]